VVVPSEDGVVAKAPGGVAVERAPSPYPGSWLTCTVYLPAGPIVAPQGDGAVY
jgi:hypothetical protein